MQVSYVTCRKPSTFRCRGPVAMRDDVQISRLSRELDEMYEWYERDRAMNPGAYNDAGCELSGLNSIPREINSLGRDIANLESNISDLESEIAEIHEVLDVKWRSA